MRRLLCTRRRVSRGEREAYDLAWAAYVEAAEGAGAHAWRFSAEGDPDLYLEFLEYGGAINVDSAQLDAIAKPESIERWDEAPVRP